MTNRRHALAFNALTRALADADRQVPLSVREQATTAILEAIDENTQPEPATLTAQLLSPVPACESGRHTAHPGDTCEEADEDVAAWSTWFETWAQQVGYQPPRTDVPPALRGPNCPRPEPDPTPLRDLAKQAIHAPGPDGLYEQVIAMFGGPLPTNIPPRRDAGLHFEYETTPED